MAEAIFISYSHRDKEFVLRLATDLEDRGAQVWIDQGDIQGGEQWRQIIAAGVHDCRAFVLVVSPDSINSQYVAEELALAFKHDRPIVPLLYRKTNIPAILKAQLDAYQFLDFGKGGYAQNFADLAAALARHGVSLGAAPELTAQERAQRRRERLGAPVRTNWGAVFGRIPGWAFAWGLGWAVFWLVLPLVLIVANQSEVENFLALPIGGFAGGLAGGLLAGLFTMLALRHNAISIRWRHMSPAIRIWGLVGPIGAIVAGGLGLVGFQPLSVDCAGLGAGECLGAILGNAIGNAILLVLVLLLYALVALFGVGAVAGWLIVRHIRRLEPGILGRQAIWVVLGWGGGAVVSALGALLVFSLMEPG